MPALFSYYVWYTCITSLCSGTIQTAYSNQLSPSRHKHQKLQYLTQINTSPFSLIRLPFKVKPAYPLTMELVTIKSISTMNIIPVKFLKSHQHLEYQREVLKMTVIHCYSM